MLKWINKKRNKKGFTLVELVVVIAILGILAAIAIPRFGGFTAGAKEGAVEANHRTIVSAAQIYYANNKAWPAKIGDLYGEYLTRADFDKLDTGDNQEGKPEGAEYKVSSEDGKCTITATFNDKTWEWDSDAGFTKVGENTTP